MVKPVPVDESQVIRKLVVKSKPGFEFILSDDAVDRYGDVIEQDGWELKHFKRNPIALFGHRSDFPIGVWKKVRVEGKQLIGELEIANEGTSDRIDEIRRLVDQGILRAVSVGFIPHKYEPIDKDNPYSGYRFLEQELVETSVVSIPANPGALAKALDMGISRDTIDLAFGEHAEDWSGRARLGIGKKAALQSTTPKGNKMKKISELIEEAQTGLNGARDALTDAISKGEDDPDTIEALSDTIEQRSERLKSLKRAEKALSAQTGENLERRHAASGGEEDDEEDESTPPKPVDKMKRQVKSPAVRRPLGGMKLKTPEPKDLIVRAAVVKVLSHLTQRSPDQILEDRYKDHEETHIVARAAVAGANTTTSGWAAELVQTAVNDFLESLRPISAYSQLAGMGIAMNFGPGRAAVKIPSRASTPSISGSFVAEGQPIPVRKLGLTSITLSPHKMGVISVFTREIARYGTPAIEALLRTEIEADTAITIDTLLLDANAGSTTRPAGLTNGVTAITASAATARFDRILEDISALAAPFDTANAGRRLALIMNPAQARRLAMAPGPEGVGFGWANQFLDEFDRIVSTTIPAGTVYLIDAADFTTATGDAPEFDISDQAVLHMEDTAPAHIGVAGTPPVVAAPVQSMFQTAQTALRMLMDVSWAMRRAGMVQFIEDVDW